MTTDFRALCAALIDALDSGIPAERIRKSPLAQRALAALAEPEPEGPTPQPVPVSEQLPGLDAKCWWFDSTKQWYFRSWVEINIAGLRQPTHWLPAHALPVPSHDFDTVRRALEALPE